MRGETGEIGGRVKAQAGHSGVNTEDAAVAMRKEHSSSGVKTKKGTETRLK